MITKMNLPFMAVLCVCIMLFASQASGFSVSIDVSPSTLNLGSEGQWISCTVSFPEPYDVADVDTSSLSLYGVSPYSVGTGGNTLNCKFVRSTFKALLEPFAPGEVELTLMGQMTDGTEFEGTDTITVNFIAIVVTSSAGPNGSISPAGDTTVNYGDDLAFTAGPGVGYQVDTWSVDGVVVQTGGTAYTLSNIQAAHTVHVTFKLLQYVVTATAGPNGLISPAGATTVTYGSDLGFTAIPGTGYQVDTWSVDGVPVQTGGTAYTLSNIQAVHIVEVTFRLLEYVVTSSAGANGSISPAGATTVTYGSDLGFTASPGTGYQVDTWSVDGVPVQTGGTAYTLSNIQAVHTVEVTFRLLEYVVTSSAGANGSISPAGATTVTYGSDLGFTAIPGTGYQVDTWSVDGVPVQTGGNTYTLNNIQAVHTVHVTFNYLGYMITPSPGLHGSITPDRPVMVEDNDSQQFTAYPNTGYEVDRWYLDGSEVQIGGNTYTLSNIQADHTVYVTFKQIPTYSLGSIEFDDEEEFDTRIVNNNSVDPDEPDKSRIHIVRVVGLGPDPSGVMSMKNWKNLDQTSPNYGQMVHARAKGSFIKTDADEILIRFKYLFNTSDPRVELVIYLSDSPELLAHDDPQRQEHYFEVARLSPPLFPRPGSAESGRFGVFEKIVWVGSLNFTKNLWIELELVEPESPSLLSYALMSLESSESDSGSVFVDDWSSAVQCYGICLDINWDNFIDEADFLTVIGGCGRTAIDDKACLEGVFSNDGTLDMFDVASWDWAMNSESRLLNFCGVPLVVEGVSLVGEGVSFVGESVPLVDEYMTMMIANVADFKATDSQSALADLPSNLSNLLIAGKRGGMNAPSKLKDRFYIFDNNGLCDGWFEPALDRCNIRLVQGPEGDLYQINLETGVLRLDDDRAVIPPGKTTYANEPRYNSSATVYVGIQSQGTDLFGRPIFDAAFDADYVYVTPVVVNPDGSEPYTATAKLELLDGANPPYKVLKLYDDPPLLNDNQYRNNLREIELDSDGSLYVLNVHSLNESNILWRYLPDGTVERLDLGRPDSNDYLPTPIAMYMSDTTDMLYLASALFNPMDNNSATIHGFSTQGALAFERSITINGMHHVTGITEDPITKSLWLVGFNMDQIPQYPNPTQWPFYYPYLTEVHYDSNSGQAVPLFDPASHDLALPMSIIWTKTVN